MSRPALPQPDIVVFGAGIIGLSIALELQSRGAQILVVERDAALRQASSAAAGMLAADDPHNPPEIQALASYSIGLYDSYLQRVARLFGSTVPYQTSVARQYDDTGGTPIRLAEHSLDPRQLAAALLGAVKCTSINLREHDSTFSAPKGVPVIHATGSWMQSFHVTPRKGQMLRVRLPEESSLTEVHRSGQVYVVPRTKGPQAGTAIIGATVEDAGFDVSTHHAALTSLRQIAVDLDPDLAFLRDAPTVEAWAGLRPASRDLLPVIGQADTRDLVATGHFRNGILLAPGTANIIADLVEGKRPAVDISAFHPDRFRT